MAIDNGKLHEIDGNRWKISGTEASKLKIDEIQGTSMETECVHDFPECLHA